MDKKITLKLEKVKSRKHYMLFCENTPFMPKIEKSKKSYNRKQKHRKTNNDTIY